MHRDPDPKPSEAAENLSAGFNGLCSSSASAESSMKSEVRTYKNVWVRCGKAEISPTQKRRGGGKKKKTPKQQNATQVLF